MSGVDVTGFVTKTLQESLDDIAAKERAEIDPALDVDPDQPIGQVNGIVAAAQRDQWELAEALYAARDPDAAEGVPLDNLCSLTGTERDKASATVVDATLTFTAIATVPADSLVSLVGHPELQFKLITAVTSSGAGTMPGKFRCTQTGPVEVPIGTLTQIVTPVAGWSAVTNATAGTKGANVESDTSLRKKRIKELAGTGNGTPDAIEAKLLKVSGVQLARCYENTTDATDENGIPAHGIYALIYDGPSDAADDDEVSAALWSARAAGTPMAGASHTTPDRNGNLQTVKWGRTSKLYLWTDYTLETTADYAGDAAVIAAVEAWVEENATIGGEVVALALKAIPLTVQGVTDVTGFVFTLLETPTPPGSPVTNQANISLGIAATMVAYDINIGPV